MTALLILGAFGLALAGQAGASGNPPIPYAGGDRSVAEDEATWYYGDAYDEEGDSLSYSWAFPGGEIIDGQDVEYTFAEPGDYSVTLWVDDGTSNASDTITVTVLDVTAPDTLITDGDDRTINEDTLQAFDGTGSTDNVAIVSFRWLIEDAGFSASRSGDTVSYTWVTPGTYQVSLFAADDAGNTGSDSLWVTVLDVTPPSASFTLATPAEATASQSLDGSASSDNVGIVDWTWTVGDDGFTSTLYGETSSYVWDTPGTYDVTLTVTDGADLFDSLTVSVAVLASEAPTAAIVLGSTIPEDEAQLLDGSGSSDNVRIADWTWTVGDDGFTATRSGETASYTWATVGTYSVTLTVTDTAGNTDSSTVSVTVVDATAPVVVFSLPSAFDEDTEQALDGTGSYDNVGIVSWTWYVEDWGGTFTYSTDSMLYTWYQPRAYDVTLELTDPSGNVGSLTQTVTVLDVTPPSAVFSLASPFDEDTPQTLDGRASDDNVAVVSWEWLIEDAGGAVYASGDLLTYSWAEPGSFAITLTVSDAGGNTGTVAHSVTVRDVTPPTAVISVAARFRVGEEQLLDAGFSFDNVGIVDWAWLVEDDGFTVPLSGATQTYTWTTPGTYTVTLTVTDGAGLWDAALATVEVLEATPPVAVVTFDSPLDEDAAQTLDGSASTDNVGVVDWTWSIEDAGFGATRTGEFATYTWETPGTYRVTLTVADAAGNTGSAEVTIDVLDVTAPVADFELPSSADNSALTLDGSLSSDNVEVVSWTWTLEEVGGPVTLTGSGVSHAWRTPGTYAVTLTVADAAGNTGDLTLSLTVLDSTAPAAAAGPDQTVSEDAVVTFDGTPTADNDPAFPEGASFAWTFTDGVARTLAGTRAYYTFFAPGVYTVTLTVADASGNTGTDTVRITVLDVTPPVASFDLPTHIDEDTELALSGALSTDNVGIVNWTWTIEDRGLSARRYGSSLNYLWSSPGTFEVLLTVRDAAGNLAERTASIVVRDITAPSADAGPDLTVDEDSPVAFDAGLSVDNGPGFPVGATFLWLFRDGDLNLRLSGASASYTFETPGVFGVTLLVVDGDGNLASDELRVTVRDTTPPLLTVEGGLAKSFDEDGPATLDASGSSDNDPSFAASGTFRWAFEDAMSVVLSGRVVQYIFTSPGRYLVTLTATDAGGNAATAQLTVDVLDVTPPLASMGAPPALAEDEVATLDASASTDNVGVVSWAWAIEDVGGLSARSGQVVTYKWVTPGTFGVTLTVRDAAGHTTVAQREVKVLDVTAPFGSGEVPAGAAEGVEATFSSSAVTDNDPAFALTRQDLWTFSAGGQWFELQGPSVAYTFRAPGSYLIRMYVVDAAGNALEQSFLLVVPDVTAPWIQLFTPEPDVLTNTLSVQVAGTAEPGATVRLNDQPVATTNGAFDIEFALLEGTNALNFVARDAAGNEVSLTLLLRAHTGAPVIRVTSPQNGAVLRTATARLEGRVTDALPRTLSIDGQAVTLAADGAFSVEVPLVEGANVLRLDALDEAGNAASLTITLVRDSQAPVLGVRTVGTFLDGTNITTYQTSIPVAGTTEPGASVRVCVEGASGSLECHAMAPAADGTFWHDAALRSGTTTRIRIEATDAAGNTAVDEFTVVQMAAPAAAVEGSNVGLLSVTGLLAAALVVAVLLPMRRRK